MEAWQLCLFGLAGFVMSILSGIAGAGGGFVMTPLGILLGLAPGQSVATGKLSGLAVTIGSLSGLRTARKAVAWRRVIPVMVLALAVGLLVPFIIRALDNRIYQLGIGIVILLTIPVMIYKKVGVRPGHPGRVQQASGGVLLTVVLLLQGAFSGGLGTLVNVVLMGMLGMTALEANVTKRWSQLILNVTIVAGVVGSGLIVWPVAAVGIVSSFAGSYVGGRLAVRKGDLFVVRIMIGLMALSGTALIVSALI